MTFNTGDYRLFSIIIVHHDQASGTPAEVGSLHWLAGMRVIILIDWGTCRNALQVAEHLVGIGIRLLLLTIVAIALDAIIGLVEPDRTAPVTLRIVLRIIGCYRREWDEGIGRSHV